MQTFFYFIGGALVVIALAVSFLGMRNESFPSTGVLRIGILFVALVVGVTLFAAVSSSQDEAQEREDEQNQEAATEEQTVVENNEASGVPATGGEQAPGARDESTTGAPAGGAPAPTGDPQAGAQVFADNGCGGCHSLQAAGATGAVGPNLDEALADKDTKFIQTSIVDPGAYVEKGFPDGTMPVDYGDVLTPDDLANLIAYLSDSTSSGGSSGSKAGGTGGAKK